ncbi:40668_t:CDS:2, partial [Gigaspora margarita]
MATPTDSTSATIHTGRKEATSTPNEELILKKKEVLIISKKTPSQLVYRLQRRITPGDSNDEPYTGRKEAEDSNDDTTPRATTPTNCKKEEL